MERETPAPTGWPWKPSGRRSRWGCGAARGVAGTPKAEGYGRRENGESDVKETTPKEGHEA